MVATADGVKVPLAFSSFESVFEGWNLFGLKEGRAVGP